MKKFAIVSMLLGFLIGFLYGNTIQREEKERLFREVFNFDKVLFVLERSEQAFYEMRVIPKKKAKKYTGLVRHYTPDGKFLDRYITLNRRWLR